MSDTLVIGDSLGVGTVPHLRGLLGAVTADVVGGRSSASGVEALRRRLKSGSYARIVLDLGTNDVTAGQLAKSIRQARRLAPNAQIVMPTLNGPYATAQKNALLRRMAAKNNITLVDWHGNKGVGSDGIHSSSAGYRRRARLIARSLGGGPPSRRSQAVPSGSMSAPVRNAVSQYLAAPEDLGALLGLAQSMRRK